MSSEGMKECIDLLVEYAQTGLLCIDERQRQLLKCYIKIMRE